MQRSSLVIGSLLILALPLFAVAQEFTEENDRVRFSLGDDIYMAGNTLNVSGQAGDVYAAGNKIIMTGDIRGDVQAAGSNVTIRGHMFDDVRIAAGDVTIDGTVDGDVMIFGGTVFIAPDARILGSVTIMGGDIEVEGALDRNLFIRGGNVRLSGSIGGNLNVQAETMSLQGTVAQHATLAANDLTFVEGSSIEGDLRYWLGNEDFWQRERAGEDLAFPVQVGGTTILDPDLGERFRKRADEGDAAGVLAAIAGVFTLFAILSAALSIAVFQALTRTFFIDGAKRLQEQPGWSILIGFLFLVLTPILGIILLATFIGIPLGIAILLIYFLTLFFAKVLTAMLFARLMEIRAKATWHPVAVYFLALGLFVVLKLLELIPVLGWIIVFVTILFGIGALLMTKYDRYRKIM